MNTQKGFLPIIVLLIGILAMAGIGIYIASNTQNNISSSDPTPTPATTIAPTTRPPYTAVPGPAKVTAIPVPPVITKDSRTLYQGYVSIAPVSLSDIKAKLLAQGCQQIGYRGAAKSKCRFQETTVYALNEPGIEIFPTGPAFGPLSYYITANKIWAEKDILGSPNPDLFKQEVRQDVAATGTIVTILENSWKITKMEYPWDAEY